MHRTVGWNSRTYTPGLVPEMAVLSRWRQKEGQKFRVILDCIASPESS